MMDSLTRLAMAQREIGLAAGRTPHGPRLHAVGVLAAAAAARACRHPPQRAPITAIYTILTEGSSLDDDPIADTARSILDGHVLLDRGPAAPRARPAGRPAGLAVAPRGQGPQRAAGPRAPRWCEACWPPVEEVRDLVEVGAYVPGTNPQRRPRARSRRSHLRELLAQHRSEVAGVTDTWNRFGLLAQQAAARAAKAAARAVRWPDGPRSDSTPSLACARSPRQGDRRGRRGDARGGRGTRGLRRSPPSVSPTTSWLVSACPRPRCCRCTCAGSRSGDVVEAAAEEYHRTRELRGEAHRRLRRLRSERASVDKLVERRAAARASAARVRAERSLDELTLLRLGRDDDTGGAP